MPGTKVNVSSLLDDGSFQLLIRDCSPTRMTRASGTNRCDVTPELLRLYAFHRARLADSSAEGDTNCHWCKHAWHCAPTEQDDEDNDGIGASQPFQCLLCNKPYHHDCHVTFLEHCFDRPYFLEGVSNHTPNDFSRDVRVKPTGHTGNLLQALILSKPAFPLSFVPKSAIHVAQEHLAQIAQCEWLSRLPDGPDNGRLCSLCRFVVLESDFLIKLLAELRDEEAARSMNLESV